MATLTSKWTHNISLLTLFLTLQVLRLVCHVCSGAYIDMVSMTCAHHLAEYQLISYLVFVCACSPHFITPSLLPPEHWLSFDLLRPLHPPPTAAASSAAHFVDVGCQDCGDRAENWLCLGCGVVLCSRFVNSHMQAHCHPSSSSTPQSHCLSLSLSDLSCWCSAVRTWQCCWWVCVTRLSQCHLFLLLCCGVPLQCESYVKSPLLLPAQVSERGRHTSEASVLSVPTPALLH